jgi:putative transposase
MNCGPGVRALTQTSRWRDRVLRGPAPNATHWSVRSVAEETSISKSTVARYFRLFGLQPHRSKSFKLSTDPFFVEKVRDVVGLYLNPPDKALVLYVGEKSQVQALERTQPVLAMSLDYLEGVIYDYYRHGTTTSSPSSTCSMARSSRGADHAIATRNFFRSLIISTATLPPRWRSTSSQITTPPTNIRESKHGWRATRAITFITRRPMSAGSTRSSAGSRSSASRRSAGCRCLGRSGNLKKGWRFTSRDFRRIALNCGGGNRRGEELSGC